MLFIIKHTYSVFYPRFSYLYTYTFVKYRESPVSRFILLDTQPRRSFISIVLRSKSFVTWNVSMNWIVLSQYLSVEQISRCHLSEIFDNGAVLYLDSPRIRHGLVQLGRFIIWKRLYQKYDQTSHQSLEWQSITSLTSMIKG